MQFEIEDAVEVLKRTPSTLAAMLRGLPEPWIMSNEGGESWSPFDILGHLIHGERTDWMARLKIILGDGKSRAFDPFDRFAQLRESEGKTLADLLAELAELRRANLEELQALAITPAQLDLEGRHPELGTVTLRQLLATWTVHDLGHIRQIARVMAKQYAAEVGPWGAYLPVVSE